LLGRARGRQRTFSRVAFSVGFDSLGTSVSHVTSGVLGVRQPSPSGAKSLAKLVAIAVRRIRQLDLRKCQFFSTSMDFATVQQRSLMVITYHAILPDFSALLNMGLGLVAFPGAAFFFFTHCCCCSQAH
jgi:hypothetical protein